jgi:hypothetical protein
MYSSISLRLSVIVLLNFVAVATTQSQVPQPQPTPISKADLGARRDAIHRELDGNHDAVKDLYEMLDTTPESASDQRAFLESQIQQYDERSNVLFEELDSIDSHEYQTKRKADLEREVGRMETEAEQLRKSSHILAAVAREAKAKSLRKALEDGSWKLLVEDEWSCDVKQPGLASTIQLTVEVEKLKLEAKSLRTEVRQLRQLVEQLMNSSPKLKLTPRLPK